MIDPVASVTGPPPLTLRAARLLTVVGVLYATTVVVLYRSHGGDIRPEIALSDRMLRGEPLYGSGLPAQGTLWPPFAALALVPFALLARASLSAATAMWSIFSVACLVASLVMARRWGWRPVALALLATMIPIQTNFEHRNVNTVLLALIVAGTADLEAGRETRAGLWFGLATALKAFPGLILVHLALQRQWRTLNAAAGVAATATLLPLLRYGPSGTATAAHDWITLSLDQARWQLATSDQSVRALVLRMGGSPTTALLLSVVCLVAFTLLMGGRSHGRPRSGIGATTLVAVLAAPIAWVHYFTLAFPAWVAVLTAPTGRRSAIRTATLFVAGLATSGWLTVVHRPLRTALLQANAYTWGALLLLLLLAAPRGSRPGCLGSSNSPHGGDG